MHAQHLATTAAASFRCTRISPLLLLLLLLLLCIAAMPLLGLLARPLLVSLLSLPARCCCCWRLRVAALCRRPLLPRLTAALALAFFHGSDCLGFVHTAAQRGGWRGSSSWNTLPLHEGQRRQRRSTFLPPNSIPAGSCFPTSGCFPTSSCPASGCIPSSRSFRQGE